MRGIAFGKRKIRHDESRLQHAALRLSRTNGGCGRVKRRATPQWRGSRPKKSRSDREARLRVASVKGRRPLDRDRVGLGRRSFRLMRINPLTRRKTRPVTARRRLTALIECDKSSPQNHACCHARLGIWVIKNECLYTFSSEDRLDKSMGSMTFQVASF
jgi:hypothetical protein